MATSKLQLYNVALAACGERQLDSLTEDRDPRYMLDEVYNRGNGAITYFLEQGLWNFATRVVQIDADTSVSVAFGWSNAFGKPDDFVRLVQISADEYLNLPLNRYELRQSYFYADIDPLYLAYVSDDSSWGSDFSLWPDTFALWAGYYLATQIGPRLKNDLDMERLEKRTKRYLVDARSKDAQQEPTRFSPPGSWVNARHSGRTGRRDRGPRNTLLS